MYLYFHVSEVRVKNFKRKNKGGSSKVPSMNEEVKGREML